MATVLSNGCTEHIGQTAGDVWQMLSINDSLSLAKLAKSIDAPRDVVMQAVGWLAREDKIEIEETKRGRFIRLK